MLAQNFKTAADLGVKDIEIESLIRVLGMLERGEIDASHFDMGSACGTVGCICGWAYAVSDKRAFPAIAEPGFGNLRELLSKEAMHLFALRTWNETRAEDMLIQRVRHDATPSQAAIALRSYLTTGDANWAEALA